MSSLEHRCDLAWFALCLTYKNSLCLKLSKEQALAALQLLTNTHNISAIKAYSAISSSCISKQSIPLSKHVCHNLLSDLWPVYISKKYASFILFSCHSKVKYFLFYFFTFFPPKQESLKLTDTTYSLSHKVEEKAWRDLLWKQQVYEEHNIRGWHWILDNIHTCLLQTEKERDKSKDDNLKYT